MSGRDREALWVGVIVVAASTFWLAISAYFPPDLPEASKPAAARTAPKQAETSAPSIAILPFRELPRRVAEAIINKPLGSAEIAVVDDDSACGLDKFKSALEACSQLANKVLQQDD